MNEDRQRRNGWLRFTVPVCVLLAIAAGSGIFLRGLYRDSPSFAAQARGQDVVSLVLVFPLMIIAAWLCSRDSTRARLIWFGGLVYLVYTYAIAAFDVKFNSLFLVYVALLGCSLYALIGSLVTADLAAIKARFAKGTPVRAVSIYIAALMLLFYSMWISDALPAALAGGIPQTVQENGTPTNAVHVLDMAWILPAFGVTAVRLWRKHPLGYTLAGASLTYVVLLASAILGMVLMMLRDGQTVVIPQLVMFATLWVTSMGMLLWYMRSASSPRARG